MGSGGTGLKLSYFYCAILLTMMLALEGFHCLTSFEELFRHSRAVVGIDHHAYFFEHGSWQGAAGTDNDSVVLQ